MLRSHVFSHRRCHAHPLALLLALTLVLAVADVAGAGWVTVDTDNGAIVEADWGTALWTDLSDDEALDNRNEINRAWYMFDGETIAFRIETRAAPALVSSSYQAVAGFDCNGNGTFEDAADRLLAYYFTDTEDSVTLYDGLVTALVEVGAGYGERVSVSGNPPRGNVEWKVKLVSLPFGCRGSVAPVGVGVSIVYDDGSGSGVYPIIDQASPGSLSHPMDYGDAANGSDEFGDCIEYPTRLQCVGARHGLGSSLRLGDAVDPDEGNLEDATATADDANGATPDDEDGVWPTQGVNWAVGATGGSLDITVSGGSGYLSCWADWSNDKDFVDAGELIISNRSVSAGTQAQTFTVPSGVSFPNTFNVRCRLYATSIASPVSTGPIEFGEVEDYQWAFGSDGNRPVALTSVKAALSAPSSVKVSWTDDVFNESYRVLRHNANPYFASDDTGASVLGVVTSAPWELLDGGYGTPANAQFYMVLGQVTTSNPDLESGLSNRVGLFEFALTPGG